MNKEYIERDYLVKEAEAILAFRKQSRVSKERIEDAMTTLEWLKRYAPAADVEEVVRCKDCRHMTLEMGYVRFCNVWERPNGMGDDGFCNYGELRADA